jgi:hypothetical protein
MLFLMFLTLFLGMLFLMCCSSWRAVPDVPHLVPGHAVPAYGGLDLVDRDDVSTVLTSCILRLRQELLDKKARGEDLRSIHVLNYKEICRLDLFWERRKKMLTRIENKK